MARISFLIPTFNRARYLGEALDSIIPQMSADDELLVIDDGSTDGTTALVARYADRVRYIRQENAGKAAALNHGISDISGEYVWICDDDDVLRPGAVPLLIDAIERTGAGFVFGRYTRFAERDGVRTDLGTGYWPDLSRGNLVRHILEDAFVMQNAALVKREAYGLVGPFAEGMLRSLDYEMFVRLATSVPAAFVDSILFDQRKHGGVRGPASMLHSANSSDEVWIKFDRQIFENLHRHTSLELFAAMHQDQADPALIRRSALLQRGTVMARHACWPEAIADFSDAAGTSLLPLTASETEICARALSGKHLFTALLDRPELAGLRDLAGRGTGRAIVEAICAGTLWRIRRGSSEERRVTLAVIRQLLGHAGVLTLAARRAFPRPVHRSQQSERAVFPNDAYLANPLQPAGSAS